MRNPALVTALADNKELIARAVRDHYNYSDTMASIGPENMRNIFASRLFKFLVRNLPPDSFPDDISIGNIKSGAKTSYFAQGLKKTGELLGIDWSSVNFWDEVRGILKEQDRMAG